MNLGATLQSGNGGSWWRKEDHVNIYLAGGYYDDHETLLIAPIEESFLITINKRTHVVDVEEAYLDTVDAWTDFRAALSEARRLQNTI